MFQKLKMKYILSFLFVCFIQQASGMANMDAFLNDLINDQDTGIFYRLLSSRKGMTLIALTLLIIKQATMSTTLKNAQP